MKKYLLIFLVQYFIITLGYCEKNNDDGYYNYRERVLESSYHGLIKENETLVEITPEIKIDETKKICGFEIEKNLKKKIPFEIELISNLGILRATKSLNCEKRKNYKFEIAAVFCDGRKSKSASVHISVSDVNEFAPEFMQPSYVIEIDEGRLYDEIIRLEAIDKDCTPRYGDVCKYDIRRNDDHLFAIDGEGSIKNLRPLEYKKSHNHILEIFAYDCAMKKSTTPALLNIRVRKICESKFFGIPERIDYAANSMETISLFPKLHLEICDEISCDTDEDDVMTVETEVALKTKHIGFGCDVNDVDGDSGMIDLLPKNAPWTRDIKYDEGDEKVFHFDGNVGIVLPKDLISPKIENFFEHSFAIYTMFRHKGHNNDITSDTDDKHRKEHILCAADDHKMNRHHFSLFIRNCRLILLVRRHFRPSSLNNIFSPAEWRWKIPQVCDNEWHRYVINFKSQESNDEEGDGQEVTLYVDGRPTNVEPEVIDDWPLHPSHGLEMTTTLAACWQGRENRLRHQFSGDISEIKLKIGDILPTQSKLLLGEGETGKCAERIRYVEDGNQSSNTDQFYNNSASEWTVVKSEHGLDVMKSRNNDVILVREEVLLKDIYDEDEEGGDDESSEKLNNSNNNSNQDFKFNKLISSLKKIKYENVKRNQTTIGRRNLEIRTRIFCSKKNENSKKLVDKTHLNRKEKVFTLPEQETYIMITKDIHELQQQPQLPPQRPTIDDNDRMKPIVDGKFHSEINQFKAVMENESDMKKMENHVTDKPENLPHNINNNNNNNIVMESTIRSRIDPEIIISGPIGSENNYVTYPSIKSGVRIFQELNFHLTNNNGDNTLDSCHVTIFPALNFDHEQMSVDDDDAINENVHLKFIKEGVEVFGQETFEKYSKILESIVYSNKKPAFYLNRVFKLRCEKLSEGREIESNDYGVTLTVLHPKQTPTTSPTTTPTTESNEIHQDKAQIKFAHAMIHPHEVQEPQSHLRNLAKVQNTSHSTMLIVVICVVFVLLILGVGIARLRNNSATIKNKNIQKKLRNKTTNPVDEDGNGPTCSKNSRDYDHQQLDWDDSSLTITINPMQDGQLMPLSDDSSESENSDSEDEEIINGRYKNVSQLEWDNSTM